MKFGFNLNLKKRIIGIKLDLFNVKKGQVWAEGTYNRCEDGMMVLYLDYDRVELKWILDELVRLQETYDLSDIHIFKSSETKSGYHIICFDKLYAKEFMEIIRTTSCDEAFKNTPNYITARSWVLRCWGKGNCPAPTYVMSLIRKPLKQKQQSSAHWKAISLIHPEIKKHPLTNPDGLTKLQVIKYLTANNIN